MLHHFGGNLLYNLLALAVYLLESYAIYRLAVIRGLPNAIFSFIPFLQLFMLGAIGDTLKYQNRSINNLLGNLPLAYALPIISVAGSILRYPFSLLAELLVSLGTVVVYYLVFFWYARKNCVLFTVIACLPVLVAVLAIFAALPLVGGVFALAAGLLGIAAVVAPIAGPLLVLYTIRDHRGYR